MNNGQNTVFPDIMAGKKILYVHGFASAGSTHTAQFLRELMPKATVLSPDLPVHPEEAMALLRDLVASECPALIIGTSMGGMYTEQLYGYDRIVVNPAFKMGDTMLDHGMVGKQTFQNPRQDGVQEFIVTKGMVKEYKEMTTHNFSQVTEGERQRVYGMFGDKDTVVDTFDLFCEHYSQAIHFHGEHRLNDQVLMHYIIPVIRRIDDKQEGRVRPVLYIHASAMKDSYGKAVSSLNKAFERLLSTYDIYFIAPAPTNDHNYIWQEQEWIEQCFSAPAWNRVVFTNQPERLFGDYLVCGAEVARELKDSDFMGTVVEWGSDSFKTWEEIIVYFERLGGQ